jgi:excisionase family DNA binding protein
MSAPILILLSLQEAAQHLGGLSIWTLRKHVARGTIRVTRVGRRVLIPSEEIERIRRDGLPSLGEKAIQARSCCEHCIRRSEVVDHQSPKSQQSNAAPAAEGRNK